MTEYNILYDYHSNRQVCNTIPVVTHVSMISQNKLKKTFFVSIYLKYRYLSSFSRGRFKIFCIGAANLID